MLRPALALLILTSLTACNEAAKTPRVAPLAAPAKSIAKAEAPRPVQVPTLCDKLTSTELPPIKIEAMKIGAAIALWREALIKVDPSFIQLGFFLPEDDAVISLDLPAGKAETSLAALLKACACDSRKGERHVNVQKEGSAFAEDGAWIAAMYEVPAGKVELRTEPYTPPILREETSVEKFFENYFKSHGLRWAPGSAVNYNHATYSMGMLLQENDQILARKVISSVDDYGPFNSNLDSVCLQSSTRLKPEDVLDLDRILGAESITILSHQRLRSESGQTVLLSVNVKPMAVTGEKEFERRKGKDGEDLPVVSPAYWTDTLTDEVKDSTEDTLTITPTIDSEGKNVELEIKHSVSWTQTKSQESLRSLGAENKVRLKSGESRILSQELESDGKHWRVHLIRAEVLPRIIEPLIVMDPVSNHKVIHADASILEKLQHSAFTGGEARLEDVLRDWAKKEKLAVKESGTPEILSFRGCGPLSAAAILQELSFRSQMQAVWKDGKLEWRWPKKTGSFQLLAPIGATQLNMVSNPLSRFAPDYMNLDETRNHLFDSPLWKLETHLQGDEKQNFTMSFSAAHLVPFFQVVVQQMFWQCPTSGKVAFDILEIPSSEWNRLLVKKLNDAELLQSLKQSPGAKSLRYLEASISSGNATAFLSGSSLMLPSGWTNPVLMDAASGTFLGPQAIYHDATSLGWTIEFTQLYHVDHRFSAELKISEKALAGQQKIQVQAQAGNKPVQSFMIEVPSLRQHLLQTKITAPLGEPVLIGRSTLPSDQAGQAATRERLFFVRIDATPQQPVIEELP